jgi:hypothetical protein
MTAWTVISDLAFVARTLAVCPCPLLSHIVKRPGLTFLAPYLVQGERATVCTWYVCTTVYGLVYRWLNRY